MFTQTRLARSLCFAGAVLTLGGGALGLASGTASAVGVGPGSTVTVGNAPYSSAGKSCDPNRDGWHFIMNQLEYPEGSVIDGNDFGAVNITFSDGSTAVASFTDLAGGNVAHFLNNTVNQTGNFTITSVTMTFPATSDITGYGNFVISHPPCGTVTTTTTTMAPTTTTTAPTTTTMAPTTTAATTTTTMAPTTTAATTTTTMAPTTTTMAPTTTAATTTTTAVPAVTTTTLLGSAAPLPTTLAPASTTSLVLSEAPLSPVAGGSTNKQLPSTGNDSSQLALLGLAVFGFGLILMGLVRDTRPVSN